MKIDPFMVTASKGYWYALINMVFLVNRLVLSSVVCGQLMYNDKLSTVRCLTDELLQCSIFFSFL